MNSPKTYRGNLQFYSETGTEGGYWAFQDERYSHGPDLDCGDPLCPIKMREKEDQPGHYGPEGTGEPMIDRHISYEGLYSSLNTGDHLKVFDPDSGELIWEGDITLPPWQDPYAENSYVLAGILASHFGPPEDSPVEWGTWFLSEYPAEITTSEWTPNVEPDQLWRSRPKPPHAEVS